MKDNFFNSMFMEGGKVSHKRWISVSVAMVACWAVVYAVVHAANDTARKDVIEASFIFVLIMSGVATVAQISSIFKGTPAPTKDEPKQTDNETPSN